MSNKIIIKPNYQTTTIKYKGSTAEVEQNNKRIRVLVPNTSCAFFTAKSNPPVGTDDENFAELVRRIQFSESSENSPSPILLEGEIADGDVARTVSDWL